MTTIESTTTLAEIVTNRPGAARVLERHGLDYCCGGALRLDAACATAGIATPAVLAEIDEVEPAGQPDWAQMAPAALVDHIEATHHAYLNTELPRLSALADKVATVHGEHHRELAGVVERFGARAADRRSETRKTCATTRWPRR